MREKAKYIRIGIVIGVILILALEIALAIGFKGFLKRDSSKVDIRLINEEIKDIGELATVEYLYTNADKLEKPMELLGKDIPISFTTKSLVTKWNGSIKAGIDIDKVEAKENKKTKEIIVSIPNAKILSHEIDNESIETLDERDGLFNKVKIDDARELDAKSKNTMEQTAIERGVLERALENAKEIIYKIINTDVLKEEGYTIVFEVIEE